MKPPSRVPDADAIYAAELGVTRRWVKRRGGAAKLKAMDPDARAYLLKKDRRNDSHTHRVGGLAVRGMGQRADGKPKGNPITDHTIEKRIRAILRERGLI